MITLNFLCILDAKIHTNNDFVILPQWEYKIGDFQTNKDGNFNQNLNLSDSNNWKQCTSPIIIQNSIVWMRFKLPYSYRQNQALYIGSIEQIAEVYLAGKQIYQHGNFNDIGNKNLTFRKVHLIPLPDNFSDEYIYFRIYSDSGWSGLSGPFWLSDEHRLYSKLFWDSWDVIAIALLFLLTAFIFLVAYLFIYNDKLLFATSIFMINLGVWTLSNSIFLQLEFPKHHLLYLIDNISFSGFGVTGFLLIENIIGIKCKNLFHRFWQIFLAVLIIRVFLDFYTTLSFPITFKHFLILFKLTCVIALVIIAISFRNGDLEIRLFSLGVGISLGFGMLEIINLNYKSWLNTPQFVHYGAGIFTIIMFYIIFNRYKLAHQRELTAIEKEKKTRLLFTQKLLNLQEQEWKRISSELHDSIGQELLVVKNLIQHGRKRNINIIADDKYYDIINEASSKAIEELKDMTRTLHPLQLEKLGLTQSIESLINKINNTTNINFATNITDIDNNLEAENEIHFFRIVQESFNNIMKHAEAKAVLVSIAIKDNEISLIIKDNGKGFNLNNISERSIGVGLNSITERVNLLKGKMKINSEKNKGTELIFSIPMGKK